MTIGGQEILLAFQYISSTLASYDWRQCMHCWWLLLQLWGNEKDSGLNLGEYPRGLITVFIFFDRHILRGFIVTWGLCLLSPTPFLT